jgi:hypothetical protein
MPNEASLAQRLMCAEGDDHEKALARIVIEGRDYDQSQPIWSKRKQNSRSHRASTTQRLVESQLPERDLRCVTCPSKVYQMWHRKVLLRTCAVYAVSPFVAYHSAVSFQTLNSPELSLYSCIISLVNMIHEIVR